MATQEVKDLFASEHQQVFRGTFTFPDRTTLVVTEADIISGSVVLDRSCVSGNSLELGACMANEFGFELMNIDNKFDGYSFAGAELYAEIGVLDDNETAYYIPLGRFIVDGVPKVRDAVSIVALDRMVKFDKLATTTLDATWWGSGKTIQQIINRCCSVCGVTLATNISSFPNVGVTVGAVDEVFTSGVESITYRQLLSYCVGAMGKCAWINPEGLLEIGFAEALDIETSAIAGIAIAGIAIVGDSSGYGVIQQTLDESNRYSSEYEDYTIAITGVFCTKTEEQSGERYEHQYIIGSDDYAFDLSENPIVAWNPSTFLANLTGVIGITYSPITAVTVPYPWLMPLDWVSYSKGDTNLYSIITNYTFTMNGNNGIQSVGESPQEKALANVGSVSKLVKQMVNYTNDVAKTTLEEAGENATALITSATGGQMYFKKENGKIVEATVMDDACYADFISDNPQYNVGTCWRWNKNGFGYSSTGYNGTYGLALTASGQIVANYITTGTMTANRINGGILKLGGSSNGDGQLEVYNSSNSLVMSANNSGLYAIAGTLGGWTIDNNRIYSQKTMGDGKEGYVTINNAFYTASNTVPYNLVFGVRYDNDWKFYVRSNGHLTATDATISGNITATSGTIGGWTIGSTYLMATANGYTTGLQVPSVGTNALAIGSPSAAAWGDAPFKVTHTGALTATNATITGKVTASSGAIAGWTITSDQIQFDSKGYANQLVSGNVQGCLRSPTANFSGSSGCLVVQSCNGGDNWTQLACVYYNGTINGTTFNTISDRNLKSDINDLDAEQSAKFIYGLKPVNYRLTVAPDTVRHGFIAQDVEEVVYDSEWGIVSEDENSTKNLGYMELIADLVATVQTQNERIKALEARIQALEER